jgi:hypothetical protein
MVATIGTRWWLPRAYRTTRTEKGKHMTTTATEKLPAMQRNTTKTTARKQTPTEAKIVAALKASPVRTDVTPADVQPATTARKPRTTKAAEAVTAPAPAPKTTGIADLESIAHKLMSAAVADAVKLAETLVKLHALKPWDTHKVTMKSYYADVMGIRADNFPFPTDARRHLVKRMHESAPKTPVAEIQAMTGASERTIKNDRAFLHIANENRQAGQPTTGTTKTPAEPKAAKPVAPAPVAGKIVVSVAVVADFLAALDDTEILDELADVIALRKAALSAK